MTDELQMAQQSPVNDTQESAMPTENQQTLELVESQEAAPQEVPSDTEATEGLPESASERTRREFEKMQKALREERTKREYYEGVFQSMQTPEQQQAQAYDNQISQLPVDDPVRIAHEASQRATRAEQSIQNYLREQENRETFSAHPELNPDSTKFDKKLHIKVRQIMTDSMVNPDDYGKQLSFKEAADLAKGIDPSTVENARREGARQAIEAITPKEQAALEAGGTSGRRANVNSNLDELRVQSRVGNKNAIRERFSKIPWGK